jgi:hypothetical protein
MLVAGLPIVAICLLHQRLLDRSIFLHIAVERQKREAEALIYDIEEDDEERAEVEAEIVKFEKWVKKVQPLLTDPTYTPSYEEMRLAVRILGVNAKVYPTKGEWPFRYQIDIYDPRHCVQNEELYYGR